MTQDMSDVNQDGLNSDNLLFFELSLCWAANNILRLRIWMFCDTSPLSSEPQNPAAQLTKPQHHGQRSPHQAAQRRPSPVITSACETAVDKQQSSQWPTRATAEPEVSEPQVSLHSTKCPQLFSWTLKWWCKWSLQRGHEPEPSSTSTLILLSQYTVGQ